jgi:hypothetical protein
MYDVNYFVLLLDWAECCSSVQINRDATTNGLSSTAKVLYIMGCPNSKSGEIHIDWFCGKTGYNKWNTNVNSIEGISALINFSSVRSIYNGDATPLWLINYYYMIVLVVKFTMWRWSFDAIEISYVVRWSHSITWDGAWQFKMYRSHAGANSKH